MRKVVIFFVLILSFVMCGCNLFVKELPDESVDMSPRAITLSSEMNTPSVVDQVKSAVVGIQANVSGGYSIGSGVAVADGGYILTNQHVVDGAKSVVLYYANQTSGSASVIWQDSSLDLAVVKSDINIPYLMCGEELLVGEDVIAIGTPLTLDFKHTVTKGIVSALNRTLQVEGENGMVSYMQNLIQHDASINPGNSGGPIINAKGEVVGINTLKASDAEGIGFAIPISVGKTAIERLSQNADWEPSYMGIFGLDTDVAMFKGKKVSSTKGVYIAQIDEKTMCKDCFIQGDIIIEINGKQINNVTDLRLAIYQLNSGDNLVVKVLRNGEIVVVNCNISQR